MDKISRLFLVVLLLSSCQKNSPPSAVFSIDPAEGYTTTSFSFDASGSSDQETSPDSLEFRWDWETDGTWDCDFSRISLASHLFPNPGEYTITLEVRDADGLIAAVTKTLSVAATYDGTFEYQGRSYKYKNIGTQTWMTENLAWLPEVFPSSDGGVQESFYYVIGYEGYTLSEAIVLDAYFTYGVLYNYHAAMTACPEGWHLPSDNEWKSLEAYLGLDEVEVDHTGDRTSGNIGRMLKSTEHWTNDGAGSNLSCFNAMPGGNRSSYNRIFGGLGTYAGFWTSTPGGSSNYFCRVLTGTSNGITRTSTTTSVGLSIRCIRD